MIGTVQGVLVEYVELTSGWVIWMIECFVVFSVNLSVCIWLYGMKIFQLYVVIECNLFIQIILAVFEHVLFFHWVRLSKRSGFVIENAKRYYILASVTEKSHVF